LGLWRIKRLQRIAGLAPRTNLFGLKLALVTVKNLLNVKSGEQITTKKNFLVTE
jgi:hypothetical protein